MLTKLGALLVLQIVEEQFFFGQFCFTSSLMELFTYLNCQKSKLNIQTLTNNFLMVGFFTVILGISGALNTYFNFFNYYFLGQNKVGMKSLSSVAGNTWRGLSSSAESIGEFYGVAIILFFTSH